MQFADALGNLFTSARARLLHVIVPPHVYGHTLALLRALGEAGPAPRPVWVLADPCYGPSRGWPARSLALARARGASAPADRRPSEPPPAPPWLDARDVFVRELAPLVDGVDERRGPVIVFAPQHIDDPYAYRADIEALARDPALAAVRWVVADAACSSTGDLVERLGDAAYRVVWPEVDAAARGALDELLTDIAARGCRLPADLEARIAPDSPLRAPAAVSARRMLHDAEKRFAAGLHDEAARLQAQVEEQLAARGLHEEAVHIAMARARSLLGAGAHDEGQRVFLAALREAERREMIAVVPEAYASLGSLHTKHRRFLDGLESYSRAAEAAERRGSQDFAADMFRCAGHAALNADMPDAAVTAWHRAFAILGVTPPLVGALDKPRQIVVLGLALADGFEAAGNLVAARGLRGHAEAIEQRNPRPSESWS